MEVLEVQSVIPRLVPVGEMILTLAALELDRKDRRARDQNGVDTAAESWDIELEVEGTGQALQGGGEGLDLLLPGIALLRIEREWIGGRQPANHLVRMRGEKLAHRRTVVGRNLAFGLRGQCEES
jgi:hypothetical protein